eukprot:scaffold828_cov63-Phaeocystis_antarctica.AAC.3
MAPDGISFTTAARACDAAREHESAEKLRAKRPAQTQARGRAAGGRAGRGRGRAARGDARGRRGGRVGRGSE